MSEMRDCPASDQWVCTNPVCADRCRMQATDEANATLAEHLLEAEKYHGAWQRCSLSLEKITRLLADAVELLEGEVEGGTVKCSDTGARIFLQECRDAIGEVYGS